LDKGLATALALMIAAGRIGSSANTFITPKLYELDPLTEEDDSIELPLRVGLMISLVGLISCILLFFIDKKSDEYNTSEDEKL
jgi:hypothetical protein